MSFEHLTAPADATSTARLRAAGLRYGLVGNQSSAEFAAWWHAVGRGFLEKRSTDEQVEQQRTHFAGRRITAVWDETAADAGSPVATVTSWPAPLTVPGGRSVSSWAISDVTVAPTHRRRGIATALLESELRTAAAHGCAIAALTVSESTIYGRFGFAPSALVRQLTIDTRRAVWTGPTPTGRVQFVTAEQLLVDGFALVERTLADAPGQLLYDGVLWERQLGMLVGDENAASLRFVRYDDASGTPQGIAIYRLTAHPADFTQHTLVLHTLVTATDDAYAALWRYLIEHDLVAKITAGLRPTDEPLRWMVRDFRAVGTHDEDHLWTRILDVPAALEARTYARPGRAVITVVDPLGFAEGTWAIAVGDDGQASVAAVTEPPEATMSANELAAIYLGTVSASTLKKAGRIVGETTTLDELFASPRAPWLSIWF